MQPHEYDQGKVEVVLVGPEAELHAVSSRNFLKQWPARNRSKAPSVTHKADCRDVF